MNLIGNLISTSILLINNPGELKPLNNVQGDNELIEP